MIKHIFMSVFTGSILCFVLLGLSGCQSTATFFQGKSVASKDTVPLSGAAQEGNWKTFDLEIEYILVKTDKQLILSGQSEMSQHYQRGYVSLYRLDVYLLFLNGDSKVIETALLMRSSSTDLSSSMPFSSEFAIPTGAVSLSFAYDGVAIESGGIYGGSATPIYYLPK